MLPIRRPDRSDALFRFDPTPQFGIPSSGPATILDMLHTANVSGSRAGTTVRITGLLTMPALQCLGRVIPEVSDITAASQSIINDDIIIEFARTCCLMLYFFF